MAPPPTHPALRFSTWLYGLLLAAYPPEFRREYGPHMRQVFRDSCREAAGRGGPPGLARLWLNTFGDLITTSFVERISERGYWDMSNLKSPVWGAAGAIGGGVLWTLWAFAPWLVPLLMIAVVCLAVAFFSLRAQTAARPGGMGLFGVITLLGGTVLVFAGCALLLFGAAIASNWIEERNAITVVSAGIGLGIIGIAAGWLTTGGGVLGAAMLGRWKAAPLAAGLLVTAQFVYGTFFIYDAPNPPFLVVGPWFALGVLTGAAYIGVGLGLLATRPEPATLGGAGSD